MEFDFNLIHFAFLANWRHTALTVVAALALPTPR